MINIPIGLISMHLARPFQAKHYQEFARLRTLGFDFIELLVPEPDELDLAATRRALHQQSLGVLLAARVTEQRNLCSDDPQARQQGLDYCRYCIDVAVELGAPLVGGPLYGNPLVFAGRAPAPVSASAQQDRVQRCIDGLTAAGEYAATANIRLGIEPLNRFETDICNTTAQGIMLVDAIGLDNVGLVLDSFHMNIEDPDPAQAIIAAGERLFHYQASENNRGMPGTGHINWSAICDALTRLNYQGAITMEPFYRGADALAVTLAQWRPLQQDDSDALRSSIDLLRSLLGRQPPNNPQLDVVQQSNV